MYLNVKCIFNSRWVLLGFFNKCSSDNYKMDCLVRLCSLQIIEVPMLNNGAVRCSL